VIGFHSKSSDGCQKSSDNSKKMPKEIRFSKVSAPY
jgi:hypothetical protein